MTQENDPIGEAIARLRERAERQGAAETGSDEAGPRLAVDAERHRLRQLEALLFAAAEPLDIETLQARLPAEAEVEKLLAALQADYTERGVRLVEVGGRWRFETAPDLAGLLEEVKEEPRRLSDAGLETLAIIAYHQPVTRAEIEEIRGVAVSRGTIDQLLELDWIRFGRRRMTPGRPVTFVVTQDFLDHFGLESARDLPGLKELRAAGLLDSRPLPGSGTQEDDSEDQSGQSELFED